MSSLTPDLVAELVPHVYEDVGAHHMSRQVHTDLSRSNLCNPLSHTLQEVLSVRNISSRRERHHTGRTAWHFLIAASLPDTQPSETDMVVDLNPWRFEGCPPQYTGYLFGTRQAVQDILHDAGAPDWYVSLRGIETIVEKHTMTRVPPMQAVKALPNIQSSVIVRPYRASSV